MTKVCNDKTGSDKMLHVFCEFIIAAVVGVLMSFVHFPSSWYAAGIAFVVAFAVGVWKECKDVHNAGNHFCLWDLLWDVLGCLLGSSVALLANYYTWHDIVGNIIQ